MMLETFGDAYREYRTPCRCSCQWVAGDGLITAPGYAAASMP